MAGSHTLNDNVFARPDYRRAPDRKGRKLAVGIALGIGAVLVATPIIVGAVTDQVETSAVATEDTTLSAFTGRAVEVDGSVMAFRQQGDVINVSVNPSDYGQRVFVQNSAGDLVEFLVSPGQSNLVATLPAAFAASEQLTIRVD